MTILLKKDMNEITDRSKKEIDELTEMLSVFGNVENSLGEDVGELDTLEAYNYYA